MEPRSYLLVYNVVDRHVSVTNVSM